MFGYRDQARMLEFLRGEPQPVYQVWHPTKGIYMGFDVNKDYSFKNAFWDPTCVGIPTPEEVHDRCHGQFISWDRQSILYEIERLAHKFPKIASECKVVSRYRSDSLDFTFHDGICDKTLIYQIARQYDNPFPSDTSPIYFIHAYYKNTPNPDLSRVFMISADESQRLINRSKTKYIEGKLSWNEAMGVELSPYFTGGAPLFRYYSWCVFDDNAAMLYRLALGNIDHAIMDLRPLWVKIQRRFRKYRGYEFDTALFSI